MNKSAIKNFAIWARRKLISDITYKAGLLGINEKGISEPLPISTDNIQFFDIGTGKPTEIANDEIKQRKALVTRIKEKESTSDYKTAYQYVVEEVAYTWFNRLIAIRFMEVNDYLPSRVRVLSSYTQGKSEPDIVTTPFDTDMEFSSYEQDRIMQLKDENKLDELFRMLFIKQCNKLNEVLPGLFEKTSDYTELLLNISFTDQEGIVNHLINDIAAEDFTEAVEIIGWLYQYYNDELKDETFALSKKNIKISKERIPAATQLFTPDWIVRYMVENTVGRLWIEMNPNSDIKKGFEFYLDNDEEIYLEEEHISKMNLEDILFIDPCMGSGHILVYAFDVFMRIYESNGYTQRDAAKTILEKNLYGLDIDNRAYQLAYFAVLMKARKYDRRILKENVNLNLLSIEESNDINRGLIKYFGNGLTEREKLIASEQIDILLNSFVDAREYGSAINIKEYNWDLLNKFVGSADFDGQMTLATMGLDSTRIKVSKILKIASMLAKKYDVVVTNPPYMGNRGVSSKLSRFMKEYYPNSKNDMFSVFTERSKLMTKRNGYYSLITQPSILFLSSFEKLRVSIAKTQSIISVLHMGRGVFGIDFGSACFVIKNSKTDSFFGKYFKLYNRTFQYIAVEDIKKIFLEAKDKKDFTFDFSTYVTKESKDEEKNIEEISNSAQKIYFEADQANFLNLPGCPYAYWAGEKTMKAFVEGDKLKQIAAPRAGMQTGENEKFVRYWYEIGFDNFGYFVTNAKEAINSGRKWFRYNKGGDYRKWYGNNLYVVDWKNDGENIKEDKLYKLSIGECLPSNSKPKNVQYYFKESITWSFVSSTSFGVRYSEAGAIFDIGGSSVFPKEKFYYILGFLGSSLSFEYMKLQNPTMNFQVGNVANLPIIIDDSHTDRIESIVKENINISKDDWDMFEISWSFCVHPLIKFKKNNRIKDSFILWKEISNRNFQSIKENEELINRTFIDIYGVQNEFDSIIDEKSITIRKAIVEREIQSLISYAVGCMFGRYSLEIEGLVYAGGKWDSSKYSSFIPDKDNCILITDEEYFEDDIVGRFIEFVKVVYGKETLEENLDFIAKALGSKGDTSREVIRNYFIKDFFKDHVKTYQKRPIYWIYDSGKQNGFKALIYMHRYTADTTGIVRVDYLHKMQKIYMGEIDRMQDMIENSTHARDVAQAEKRKEKLIKQLKETKEYDEKIAHIALSRIDIDLDDGVKVNYDKAQTAQDGKKLDILAKI